MALVEVFKGGKIAGLVRVEPTIACPGEPTIGIPPGRAVAPKDGTDGVRIGVVHRVAAEEVPARREEVVPQERGPGGGNGGPIQRRVSEMLD